MNDTPRDEKHYPTLLEDVGAAISYWAVTETMIVTFFSFLLQIPTQQAGCVLYSITSFGVWLNIITELVETTQDDALQKNWGKLASQLRSAKEKRDLLAHNTFLGGIATDLSNPDLDVLSRPMLDFRNKSVKSEPLTRQRVRNTVHEISEMNVRVARFLQKHFDLPPLELPPSPDT